jgi:hypothetical protein
MVRRLSPRPTRTTGDFAPSAPVRYFDRPRSRFPAAGRRVATLVHARKPRRCHRRVQPSHLHHRDPAYGHGGTKSDIGAAVIGTDSISDLCALAAAYGIEAQSRAAAHSDRTSGSHSKVARASLMVLQSKDLIS